MKNILCFGDSNTFGTNPLGGRWGSDIRWTGRLQTLLQLEWHIIEEGMGGRTTVWNDCLGLFRNGRESLPVALASHKPIDLVILMLGTNDLKSRFNALPADIADGARQLVELIQTYAYGVGYPTPQVLLVSPILLGEDVEHSIFTGFENTAVDKSRQLAGWMERAAQAQGCHFLDAAQYAQPSTHDWLHMDAESHAALAIALEKAVREILD